MNAIARRSRNAPLFVRVFAVMLLAVAAVQLVSIALVMMLPAPTPRVFTLPQVAAALKTDADRTGELRLSSETAEAPTADEDPRTLRSRKLLAVRLGVSEDRVRLHHTPPPRIAMMGSYGMPRRRFERPPEMRRFQDARDELLFGEFTASVQLADGSWRSVKPVRVIVDLWRWRALLWLIAAMLAVTPLAWLLARRLARPIALFAGAAERLGRDPRAPPLPVQGPPEIAEAAAAFNEMQARLTRYVEDRSMLMAAIAHDLRTPLMRLGLRLEHAPDELRHATEGDIRDMEAMIAAVLSFLRDLSKPARRQRLDLRALAESVTDGFVDQGQKVELLPGEPVVIEGDPAALKTVLSNLIGNAVTYAGSAEVTLSRPDGQAIVEVLDHGPGIPAEALNQVFEPFFRLERSRSRETGGAGLGLASARAVARAHGGDIALANRPDGGLLATVTLPA